MPIYQYKATDKGCDYCRHGFEQMQSMKDKPLTKCPRCGAKIKKCPSLCSGYTPMLSNGNLRDKGFTKLQKRGDGTYEKTT
jgi:putative FmdB family regulatory protein